MPGLLLLVLITAAAALAGLMAWRLADRARVNKAWRALAGRGNGDGVFDPASVRELPEPARRFFSFAIEPGATLHTVCDIEMQGEIGLGSRDAPNYQRMRAREILVPFEGFVWRVAAGSGPLRFSGSDGLDGRTSWSRIWLYGIVPVVRAGNGEDHRRSAFGRLVAECLFWTPAAFLPGEGVHWEALDADSARVSIAAAGLRQAVDIRVTAEGRPASICLSRWSNANPAKQWQLQPFGGQLADFETFDGFRLPTRVEAGNFFGTDDYFPFFRARVTAIRFGHAGIGNRILAT